MTNPNLMDEKDIPENWQPIDAPSGKIPAPPVPHDMPQYFSGSLPPSLQHDTSFVGTEVGSSRIPKTSLMPLGSQANAFANAATQSTAQITAVSTAVSSDDTEVVNHNSQSGTTYTVQLGDRDTLISMSNAAGGTVILPPTTTGTVDNVATNSGNSITASASGTSNAQGEGVLLIEADTARTAGAPTPGSWTLLAHPNGSSSGSLYSSFQFAASSLSESQTLTSGGLWATMLGFFHSSTALAPTLVQSGNSIVSGGISPGTFSNPFALPITTGSGILVLFVTNTTNTAPVMTVFDNRNNVYTKIGQITSGTGGGILAFWAPGALPGTTTVTVSLTAFNGSGEIIAYEIGGIGLSPALAPLPKGFYCWVENTSSGTFLVSSGATIDGVLQVVSLGLNQGALFTFDGIGWFTERGIGLATPVTVPNGGTGDTTLTAHAVLLGEGVSPVAFAAPGALGTVLTSTGANSDPTFQALPSDTDFYQTVQLAGVSKPQELKLNFSSGFVVTDNPGSNSTDVTVAITGLLASMKINGVSVSADKEVDIKGIKDFAVVWGVAINGVSDGG